MPGQVSQCFARVMRVAPGQAVTFTVYEFLKGKLEGSNWAFVGGLNISLAMTMIRETAD
jgi:hypothetical protein